MKAELDEKKMHEQTEETLGELVRSRENLGNNTVTDHADYIEACELLFATTEQERLVALAKDAQAEDAKTIVAAVSKAFKPLQDEAGGLVAHVKELVRTYWLECEERHAKALKKASTMAKTDAKLARKIAAEAEDLLPPKVKGIAFQARHEVTVLDERKVPERFFRRVLDEAALRAAAESGDLDDKTAAQWGLSVADVRIVKVTPSQREK